MMQLLLTLGAAHFCAVYFGRDFGAMVKQFEPPYAASAGVSRGLESRTSIDAAVAAGRRHADEIRNQTGWEAHTVRGFISRNLS
jgi:hypothetical protein